MKNKAMMVMRTLFDDLPSAPQADTDGSDWGDFDTLMTFPNGNRCTLDGRPARVIGCPKTSPYATIEPLDLEADPMETCWDVVEMVMQEHGEFFRSEDNLDSL